MKAHENPFASERLLQVRYCAEAEVFVRVVEQLLEGPGLGSLVGKEGSGKTTFMEDLRPWFDRRCVRWRWLSLTADQSTAEQQEHLAAAFQGSPGEVLLLDGGEALSHWHWHRLLRAVRRGRFRLLATLHRKRNLPVLMSFATTEAHALSLASELAGNHWEAKMEAVAREAYQGSQGNVREVFRACYLFCSRL